MLFLKSAVLAFSMFSAIPMPRVEWNARSMRYMLAAFPLVGAVIGALFVAAGCGFVALSDVWAKPVPASLAALVLLLLPVLVTGGIHVDGFMDTCDALGSHADREKKLAIMKDPHAGSFAVLGCVLYFVAQYALLRAFADYALGSGGAARRLVNQWQQVQLFLCAASAFVFSRLLSALAVATFPIAKNSGLVRTFSDASARRFTAVWCALWFAALAAALGMLLGARCAAVPAAELLVFAWYYAKTKRAFGGITGDTAGAFVQLAELAALAAQVVTLMV